jgi:hypothetical protein
VNFVTARLVPAALTDTGPPTDHIKIGNRELGHVTGEIFLYAVLAVKDRTTEIYRWNGSQSNCRYCVIFNMFSICLSRSDTRGYMYDLRFLGCYTVNTSQRASVASYC